LAEGRIIFVDTFWKTFHFCVSFYFDLVLLWFNPPVFGVSLGEKQCHYQYFFIKKLPNNPAGYAFFPWPHVNRCVAFMFVDRISKLQQIRPNLSLTIELLLQGQLLQHRNIVIEGVVLNVLTLHCVTTLPACASCLMPLMEHMHASDRPSK